MNEVDKLVGNTQKVICGATFGAFLRNAILADYAPCFECITQAKQILFGNNLAIIVKGEPYWVDDGLSLYTACETEYIPLDEVKE